MTREQTCSTFEQYKLGVVPKIYILQSFQRCITSAIQNFYDVELSVDDYHVGIVRDLNEELSTVMAMLDGTHNNDIETTNNDTNSYFYGGMSGHNIVAACLPVCEPGSASAVTVATNMASTFKQFRFGLPVLLVLEFAWETLW